MVGSKQNAQRKARYNAPLHVRHRMVAAHLSKELKAQYKRRAVPLRTGDEVVLMRGKSRKVKGTVKMIDLKNMKIFVEGLSKKKVNGAEALRPIDPSNVRITKLVLEDKRRVEALSK